MPQSYSPFKTDNDERERTDENRNPLKVAERLTHEPSKRPISWNRNEQNGTK